MSDKPIKLSVTTLADFACRSGDLGGVGVVGPTATEGMRAHQRVQKAATTNSGIESEVRLMEMFDIDGRKISLGGRLDLLDIDKLIVTEVKSTLVPIAELDSAKIEQHWSQISLYGALLARQQNLEIDVLVTLELTFVNLRSDTQERVTRDLSASELINFAEQALEKYLRWIRLIESRNRRLQDSAAELDFPFGEFRDGQRDMSAAIYRAARDKYPLLCEAPTGIGKTISALFPIVKLLGENKIAQAVYLTAKVSGRQTAFDTISVLEEHGLSISAISIRSKQPTCFCSNGRCERDDAGICPMTIGFYDRLPDAREELIGCGVISAGTLDDVAWNHQLCPFELALQMLPWIHVVIADYNYVFDPLVCLPHFSESRRDTVLLIDEAHNLLDRSRSMFSANLDRMACVEEIDESTPRHMDIARQLEKLQKDLLRLAPTNEPIDVSDDAPKGIIRASARAVEAIVDGFGKSPAITESQSKMFRTLCRVVAIGELFGDEHRTVTRQYQQGRKKQVHLNLKCLDASRPLSRQYKRFRSVIMFSATLRPSSFYRDVLGLPSEAMEMRLDSPYDPENAFHCVVPWVNTRYRHRENSARDLVRVIHAVIKAKEGNYLVFFPSFSYLNQIHQLFSSCYPSIDTWLQSHDTDPDELNAQLLKLGTPGHRVGFAILGGKYGEGVDYPGDKLIGVVVVGVGLPGFDEEQALIQDHFEKRGFDGYDFTYRYPGVTRVLQTAGRVIRGESDKGVVVLIDDRFRDRFYQQLFPEHWQVNRLTDVAQLEQNLTTFWDV